jgi:hypothetical protein
MGEARPVEVGCLPGDERRTRQLVRPWRVPGGGSEETLTGW